MSSETRTSCTLKINAEMVSAVSFMTMSTRMGLITYSPEDIYTIEDGLAGFRHVKAFIKTALPGAQENASYGILQAKEDEDLAFILFFPTLDVTQYSVIAQRVKTILMGESLKASVPARNGLDDNNMSVGFLVIVKKTEDGSSEVSCVQDAPIVFLHSHKKAWQIVLS